jgi:hypothetical protein
MTTTTLQLQPKHLEDLYGSGLKDEIVAKYDFSSITQNEASHRALGGCYDIRI